MCFIGGWLGDQLDDFKDNVLDDFLGVVPGKGGLVGDLLQDADEFLFHGGLEDFILDVGRKINEEVFEPIWEYLDAYVYYSSQGDFGDALWDMAKLTVAIVYPPALPFVTAAAAKDQGADWDEALLEGAKVYAGQQISQGILDSDIAANVAGGLEASLTAAGISGELITTFTEATGNIFTSGLAEGSVALLEGDSFSDGFVAGAILKTAQMGTDVVMNFVDERTDGYQFKTNKTQGPKNNIIATDGQPLYNSLPDGSDDLTSIRTDANGLALKAQEVYNTMPGIVQNVLARGVQAKLQGQEVTDFLLAEAAFESLLTAETLGELIEPAFAGTGLDVNTDDGRLFMAFLAPAVQRSAAAITTMGFGGESALISQQSFSQVIDQYSSAQLFNFTKDAIQNTSIVQDLLTQLDGLTGKTEAVEIAANNAVVTAAQLSEARDPLVAVLNQHDDTLAKQREAREAVISTAEGQLMLRVISEYTDAVIVEDDPNNPGRKIYTIKEGADGDIARAYNTHKEAYEGYREITPTYVDAAGVTREYAPYSQIEPMINTYKESITEWNTFVTENKDLLENSESILAPYKQAYENAAAQLQLERDALYAETDSLGDYFDTELQTLLQNDYVQIIQPDFDETFYINLYGPQIEAGMTAQQHWLAEGAAKNYIVSQSQKDALEQSMINRFRHDTIETVYGEGNLNAFEKSDPTKRAALNTSINNYVNANFYDESGNFKFDSITEYKYFDEDNNEIPTFVEGARVERYANQEYVDGLIFVDNEFNTYLQQSSGLSLEEYVNQLNTVPSPVATPLMLNASISSYSGQQVNDYFNDLLLYGGIGLDAVTGRQEYVSRPTTGEQYQFNPFTGERETLLTNGVSFASLADSDPSGFFSTVGDLLGNWFQTWSEATGAAYQSKAEYDQGRRAFINEQMASGAEVGKKWWWSTIDVLSNATANATETALLNNVPGAELQYKVNVDANGDVVSLFSQQNAPGNSFVYYDTKEDVPREFLPYASLDYKRDAGGQIITDVANIAKVEEKKLDINNYFSDVWDRVRMTGVYTLAGAEGLLSWVQTTFVAGAGYFINMDAQEILDNPVYKWFDVATQATEAARLTLANQFDPTYETNLAAMNNALSPINLAQRAVDDPATPYINETVWDTMAIFGDNYQAYPTEFVAEVVFKESVEELGPFAAGIAVKKGVEAFPEISSNVASGLGLGTAFSLEVAESAGGEYVGNFEEAKAVIAQVLRDRRDSNQDITWTNQQINIMADHYAQGIARETATYAGVLTAAMFFAGGGALDQSAMRRMGIPPDVLSDLGRKLNNDFLIKNGTNAFQNGAAVVSKELLSEYIEEYSIANKFESLIYEWDNTRNIPGNVQFAGQFGALIAGTATTAGILFNPGEALTDKDGNSYAEEFDIPTFSEATGRLEYKPTGNLTADFLLANVPEIATAVYTGNASSIDSILPTLGITGDVATALADAANDPYYADTIYRLPSPSPGYIDPDFNTFPVGTNNELYYDPTSAGTYKFKDGNWTRTANGNQTISDWKSYNEYGTIVDVTMPTFEEVKRSIQMAIDNKQMLESRFVNIDGYNVQGFNFPDVPKFPGYSGGVTYNDAARHAYHPANNIPANWESLTYDQLLPYYTGFNTEQELIFFPSADATIDFKNAEGMIEKGEPYIPPGQTEPGYLYPGWSGADGYGGGYGIGDRRYDESITADFDGIENQLITDPNTGDQYLVSVTLQEGQNAIQSKTRLTKWIGDAPSAYEVWNRFIADDEGSWVSIPNGGAYKDTSYGDGGQRLRYLPPVTVSGGSALNTRNGEGMFGGWETLSTYGDMEFRKTTFLNNIPELLQDGKGQTLGGMEAMINNAAGYVMMATSEADFKARMEDYSTVYEAYWPYIARERAKYGLKNKDTVNEAFYGGSIPIRIKTINPYDVTGVEDIPGAEVLYTDDGGYSFYKRAPVYTTLPTSEYVNNLLYPNGLLADGEGNFIPKVTDFPVAPTNTAPEKWWDQENHHRYYDAYDPGISYSGNSTDAEGLFIPVSEEMAIGTWSADTENIPRIESGRFSAGSVPWQWLVNPAYHTEPEHGEVTTFSYIRNNSLGRDHSGYGGLGYKGVWIHPFEKDARGDGLQYVYKNGQWRAAWYWHPAVDDNGQWIPYDQEGGERKGLKVNTGTSNTLGSSWRLPIWTSATGDTDGQITNFEKPYRSDRNHVWGHSDGENGASPGLGATTEEFLTNIGFTGSYDDFPPATRARLQTPYFSSGLSALPPGMIDPIAQQEEYEQAQFDYFISKSVENGWSIPDANYYVFKNGRDILNVMDGMQDTDDFDAYFVNNANQAQTFNGIDPSPTLTLSSYKRLFTDTYGLSEEEFYAMHRSPSLGMTNEAVDDTLNNYVFNQVEDPNKLDAFGNPIIGIRGNSDFVQNFVANNINTREDIIAKYKAELGQSYEPTEAEINQFLGYRYKLDDNGDHDLRVNGTKKEQKQLNNIDISYFTESEREDAVESRVANLSQVQSNFFELDDPIKLAQFKNRLIDLYQHDPLLTASENATAFDTLVRDTINNEYNQNLRRRNAVSQLRTQLFTKDARSDEEYKKYSNINVSTYDEDQEAWIEANFGAALDAYYAADPTKYTVPINDIKTLIENYEATEKAKLTAVLPGRSNIVDELFRVNGTVADAQKLADIVTNFEAKWGYTPSEKDLYILGANAGLSVSGIKNTNNTFGLFNSFATGGRQVNNYFAAQNAFRTIKEEFEKYGYTPDDAEIRGYMNAVNTNLGGVTPIPVLNQNVIDQIEAYVAPKMLDEGEVKGLLENAGITAAEFEARFGYDPISRYTDTRIDSFDAGLSPLENDISTFVADRELQAQIDYDTAEYNRIAAEFSKYGIDIFTHSADMYDLASTFYDQDLAGVEQAILDAEPNGAHANFLKRSRLVEYFESMGEAIPSEQDLQTMMGQMTGTTKAELTDINQISTVATTYLAAQTYDTSDVKRDLAAELGIEESLLPADFDTYITNLAAEELTDGDAAGRVASDIAAAEIAFGLYDESTTELADALGGTIADIPKYLEDKQYTRADAKADLAAELGIAVGDVDENTYGTYLDGLVDMTGARSDDQGETQVQSDITGYQDILDQLVGEDPQAPIYNIAGIDAEDLASYLGKDVDVVQAASDYVTAEGLKTNTLLAKEQDARDILADATNFGDEGAYLPTDAGYETLVAYQANNALEKGLDNDQFKTNILTAVNARRYSEQEVANDIIAAFPQEAGKTVAELKASGNYDALFDLAGTGAPGFDSTQRNDFDQATVTQAEAEDYFRDTLGYGDGFIPSVAIGRDLVGVFDESDLATNAQAIADATTVTPEEVRAFLKSGNSSNDYGLTESEVDALSDEDLATLGLTGKYWQEVSALGGEANNTLAKKADDATTDPTELRNYLRSQGFDVGSVPNGDVMTTGQLKTAGMSDALGFNTDLANTQSVIDYMDRNEITGDEIRSQIVTETGVDIYEEDGVTLKAEFTDQALTNAGFLVDTKGRDGYQAANLAGNVADNTISESDIRTWLGNNDYAAPGAGADFSGYTGLGTDIAGQAGQYVTDEGLITQTQTTINNERQAVRDYFDTAHSYFDEDAAVNFDIDALRNADPATMQAAVDALVDDQTLDFDEIKAYFQTELGYDWVPSGALKQHLLNQAGNPNSPTPRQLTADELNELGQLDSVANIAGLPGQATLDNLIEQTTISPEEVRAYLKGQGDIGGRQIDVPYNAAAVDALTDEDLATLGLTGNYGWESLALAQRVLGPSNPANPLEHQGNHAGTNAFRTSGFYDNQNQDEDEARAYLAGLGLTQATELNDPADPDSGYKVDFATINNLAGNSLEGRFDAAELARRAALEGGYFDQNDVTAAEALALFKSAPYNYTQDQIDNIPGLKAAIENLAGLGVETDFLDSNPAKQLWYNTTVTAGDAKNKLKANKALYGFTNDAAGDAAIDALTYKQLEDLGVVGRYWENSAGATNYGVDPATLEGTFLLDRLADKTVSEADINTYLTGEGFNVTDGLFNNLGFTDQSTADITATYRDENEVTFDEIREQIANELGVTPATLYDENGDPIAGYTDTEIAAAGFTQGKNVVETGLGTEITDNVLTRSDIENHLLGLGYSQPQIDNFDSSNIAWNDTTALDELTATFQADNRNATQQAIAADLATNFGWLNATDDDIAAVADLDAAGRGAWVGDRRFTSAQAATALANVGVPTDHPEYNNLLTALIVDQDRTGNVPATQAALVDSVENDPLLDPLFIDPSEVATEFAKYDGYFTAPEDLLPFTGLIDDTGLPTTIETYVNENYVTADEARAALDGVAGVDAYAKDDQDNYIITDQQLLDAELTGQYVDTVENQALAGKVQNLTTDEAEARDLLIAQGVVNPSAADIQNYMGFTPEAPTFTPTDIADLRYRGILEQFGTPAVYSDTDTNPDGSPVLVTPATGIYAEIDSLRGQGLDAGAINTAISTYITGLGLPTSGDLNTLQTEIQDYIGDQGFFTGDITDIQRIVSDVIGKPAELVTQDDIDYVNNIIQGNIGVQDPTYDPTDLGLYDVNNDGFINIDDKNLLDQLYAGQDAEYNQYVAGIDPTSQFADTGIFGTLAYEREQDRLADIARQEEIDAQTQTNINLQNQINAQRLATQEAEQKQLLTALAASQPPQQQMKQEEPELAEMGPRYDFSTIFSTPEVAAQKAAVSPYGGFRQKAAATGGLITNETDELLALLEEIG